MSKNWEFRITQQEARSRRLILEGYASPPYERPYYDELFFYAVIGPGFLSLEVSRDFDGERLLEYLFSRLGEPTEPTRTQVGGREDEEEGALLLTEWHFPPDERGSMIQCLAAILGHPLPA